MSKLALWGVTILVVIGLLSWGGKSLYDKGHSDAVKQAQIDLDVLRNEMQKKVDIANRVARDAEQESKRKVEEADRKGAENANKIREDAQTTIARYESDNLRLRKRLQATSVANSRSGTTSAATGPGMGSSGSVEVIGLQQSDVKFLVRFGSEADEARNALKVCLATNDANVAAYQQWYNKTHDVLQ